MKAIFSGILTVINYTAQVLINGDFNSCLSDKKLRE